MMAGAFEHYRVSMLGQELEETLEELISNNLFDGEKREAIWQHFDRAIANALSSWVRTKAVIKGPLSHYRNHDDIWSFFLNAVEIRIDGMTIASSEKTKIISVSKR